MKMIRQYFDVRDVIWSSETKYSEGVLAINKAEVLQKAEPFMDSVARVDLEVVKPGERAGSSMSWIPSTHVQGVWSRAGVFWLLQPAPHRR